MTHVAVSLRRWPWVELGLLGFPLVFLALGFWLLRQLDVPTASGHLWPAAVAAAGLIAAHVALGVWCPRHDPVLLPLVAMLNAVGLVMIERLASNFTARQVVAMLVGLTLAVVLAAWPHALSTLRRVRYSLILPGILVLLITVLIGLSPLGGGQSMFLRVGPIGFQPSEPLKLLLIIFLASYLDQHHEKFRAVRLSRLWRERRWLWVYFPMLFMWGFAMILLVLQRDLGAALLFFGIFLSMTYLATARRDYALIGLGLFAVGASAAVQLFAHVRARLLIWRNPWPEADERAFQVVQALLAVAAGGVLGQGLGQGYPDFVPVVHSDFILVAVAEEFGVAGVLATVGLYLMLMERGFRAALRARDGFAQLLAGGITVMLCLQAFIIMAGTLKLIPLTGVTLPFVSYGGSSLMTSYAATGLLLRVSADEP